MKKIIFLLVFICPLIFSNCITQDKHRHTTDIKLTTLPTPICYILCDYSLSQNENSLKEMENNAIEIFSKINRAYSVIFFDTRSSQRDKVFFEYTPPEVESVETPIEKDRREKYFKYIEDSLAQKLEELSAKPKSQNTCLIRAIDKMANEFSNDVIDTSLQNHVVILSDMLEDCDFDLTRIRLENNLKIAALNSVKNINPSFKFTGYRIDISIMASSNNVEITNGFLKGFWTKVFEKYDCRFTGAIATSVPKWIKEITE